MAKYLRWNLLTNYEGTYKKICLSKIKSIFPPPSSDIMMKMPFLEKKVQEVYRIVWVKYRNNLNLLYKKT